MPAVNEQSVVEARNARDRAVTEETNLPASYVTKLRDATPRRGGKRAPRCRRQWRKPSLRAAVFGRSGAVPRARAGAARAEGGPRGAARGFPRPRTSGGSAAAAGAAGAGAPRAPRAPGAAGAAQARAD